MRAVDRQRILRVDEAASFANPPRANFAEPDRPKDGEQPTVEPGSQNELIGALDRARTRRLNEVLGYVARPREDQASSPARTSRRLASLMGPLDDDRVGRANSSWFNGWLAGRVRESSL